MDIEPRLSTAMVTLLGKFTPTELTPSWFAERDLLPQRMIESAKTEASNGSTSFVSDWLRFTAHPERISAETAQGPYVRACDLVARMFHEHLFRNTSIEGFVILRESMYPVETERAFDQIAGNVMPFAEWTNLATDKRSGGEPTSVVVTQQQDDDACITLQLQGVSNPPRIGVSVAEMCRMRRNGNESADRDLIRMLGRFNDTVRRSDALIERVMSQAARRQEEV